MKRKTQVHAGKGTQDILITREFNLPVSSLYRAFVDPEIVAQWMSTNVIRLENKPYGSWQFETSDPNGNIVFSAHGVFHSLNKNTSIIRTFEMGNTAFPVQLEFLEFEPLTENTSKLSMQIVFRTEEDRDNLLKLPFAQGLSMAHDRLQAIAEELK